MARFVLRCSWSIERWIAEDPSVEAVRPERCPRCGEIYREGRRGRCRVLHGHGRRCRPVLGPRRPGGPPEEIEILGRRYRCVLCKALMIVLPAEVLPGRRYSAPAILWALALWSWAQERPERIRARVSPWRPSGFAEPGVWPSLRRWVRERLRLWPEVVVPARPDHRATAGALAHALCARLPSPPLEPIPSDAWRAATAAVALTLP